MQTSLPLSNEVILPDDGGEVVSWLALHGGGEALELLKPHRVVDALLEEVELGLAHSQQAVHLEEALSRIVEGLKADWLEGQVL